MPNAAQLLISQQNALAGALLNATRTSAPLMNALEAYEMRGTSYRSIAINQLPSAGGFKYLGEGGVASSAAYSIGKVEASRLYPIVEEEKSTTDLMNDDLKTQIANGDIPDWLTLQMRGKVAVETQHVDKQIILGVNNDPKGFIGLRDCVDCSEADNVLSLTTSPNADGYVRSALNVGGSTSSTGSRIYLLSGGINGVCLRMGGPQGLGGFLQWTPVTTHRDKYTDPLDSIEKIRTLYHTEAEGYVGLSVFGDSRGTSRTFTQRVLRVAFNVTAQAGYTATESVLDALINSLPPESRSSLLFVMSNRSRRQVRDSKSGNTQVNINMSAGDAAMRQFTTVPDLPESHRGVPIIESDWVADTDTIITPA